MLKIPFLALIAFTGALSTATAVLAADSRDAASRQISILKGEFQVPKSLKAQPKLSASRASGLTTQTGTLTIDKVITYDMINLSPYNAAPVDTSVFNATYVGYMPAPPVDVGAISSSLQGIRAVAFARAVKLFAVPPIPEADLLCNLWVSAAKPLQGVIIDGVSFPLGVIDVGTKDGITTYEHAAIVPQALDNMEAGVQYLIAENAACAIFDSLDRNYPNGTKVSMTAIER